MHDEWSSTSKPSLKLGSDKRREDQQGAEETSLKLLELT